MVGERWHAAVAAAPPLTPQQRAALRARFGAPGTGRRPLREVAAILGVSEPRASQLCTGGLVGLARIARARGLGLPLDAAARDDWTGFGHLLDRGRAHARRPPRL
jgi:hypothetical protein